MDHHHLFYMLFRLQRNIWNIDVPFYTSIIYVLALLIGPIFQISGATFVQLLRVLNIGLSNFQTHFLKLFATLCNRCYNTQQATFIIKGCGKANETKSRSPWRTQSIPLSHPQLETPPGTICLEDLRKRHEAALNLVPCSPFSHSCLWPSSSNWPKN